MECNDVECSTDSCRCETMSKSCGPSSCECPSCTGQNPMDFVEMMWHKAAMAAMLEIKKDKVKSRLEKSFGKSLDQGADAVVDAVAKKMQSAMINSSTEEEFRGKLRSILKEAFRN